jgi:hypothetical protein
METPSAKSSTVQAQVHSKFKIFVSPLKVFSYFEALPLLEAEVEAFTRNGTVAAKSLGVEYLEGRGQLVLSLGYRDDEPGYPVKITTCPLGKLDIDPASLERAVVKAAASVANPICHELFAAGPNGEFTLVLLSHG